MPKAIRFKQLGGPEVLHIEDLPARKPGPGEVLLNVEAVGLNRAESIYYRGHYMEKVNLPSRIGYEATGTISAALGASKATILRMVLGDGLQLAVVGMLLGMAGVVGLSKFLRSLLFEIKPFDPATLIFVTCTLLIVSLLASLIPAQRATRVDPAAVLRDE